MLVCSWTVIEFVNNPPFGTMLRTVFVPTNDAFGKIPEKQMDALINEKDQVGLKALLSYHILPGKFFAANISSSRSKPTITGAEVKFTDFGELKVNDSGVQARNIEASNGVIHAVDTVLTPKKAKAA